MADAPSPTPLPSSPVQPGSGHAPIAKAVARGVGAQVVLSLVARASVFVSQVVLGRYLTDRDYGTYAGALWLVSAGAVVRDAGSTEWLVQRGGRGLMRHASSVFWLSSVWNALAMLVIVALGWGKDALFPAQDQHSPHLLGWMVTIAALALPLGTLGTLASSALRIRMQFGWYALVQTVSHLTRTMGAALCAVLGMGALSLVAPMVLASLVESLLGWRCARRAGLPSPWRGLARVRRWRAIVRSSRWIVAHSGASMVSNVGDFVVLGMLLTKDRVGVYFFGVQLIAQVGAMFASNLQGILFPAFAALRHEPERLRAAFVRTLAAMQLVVAPATIGLGVIMAPLERLLWSGKWQEAAPLAALAAFLYPFRSAADLPGAALMAQGRFRAATGTALAQGLAMAAGAAISASLTRELLLIVLGAGIARAACALGIMLWFVRGVMPAGPVLKAMLWPWALAAAPALLVHGMAARQGEVLQSLPSWAQCLLLGGAYGVLTLGAMRLGAARTLADIVGVLPARARAWMGRALMLPARAQP